VGRDLIEVPRLCMAQGEDLDEAVWQRYPGV